MSAKTNEAVPYSVNLWGSDPVENNDDCWMGLDFDTYAEARAAFDKPESLINEPGFQHEMHRPYTIFIELCRNTRHDNITSCETLETRRLRADVPKRRDDNWQREIAMEAGMLHGIDAYNDAMGW